MDSLIGYQSEEVRDNPSQYAAIIISQRQNFAKLFKLQYVYETFEESPGKKHTVVFSECLLEITYNIWTTHMQTRPHTEQKTLAIPLELDRLHRYINENITNIHSNRIRKIV